MDELLTLGDGRTLGIEVAGDRHGPVVVMHHGTPGSRMLFPTHVADAAAKGICLVGYDRPGYGGSTGRQGRRVADAVDDLRAIAAHLGVDRLVTWGISGGGPHVLACAALAPDLVAAAASLASLAPYGATGLDFFAGMGERNVEDFRLSLDDPPAYAAQAAADRRELLEASVEELQTSWAGLLSEVDARALTGELATGILHSMQLGLAPAVDGYLDDSFAFVQPWGFQPADIEIPVLVWQGRHDRFVPFGHGQWFSTQIPRVEAHLSDEDGHLTLLRRVDEVHQWLLARLS